MKDFQSFSVTITSERRYLCNAGRSCISSYAHIDEERLGTSCYDRTCPLWLHQVTTSKAQEPSTEVTSTRDPCRLLVAAYQIFTRSFFCFNLICFSVFKNQLVRLIFCFSFVPQIPAQVFFFKFLFVEVLYSPFSASSAVRPERFKAILSDWGL